MSLDKSIQHGKEHRKPYRGSKAVDRSCRNHGSCDWCKNNRLHKFRKNEDDIFETELYNEDFKNPVKCNCGGNPVVTEGDQYDSFQMLYTVYCDKCGITTDIYTDRNDAITAWNVAMRGNKSCITKY